LSAQRASRILNHTRIECEFVYVISSASDVYHIPADPEDRTLCGLSVAPIVINRPVKTSTLYLTENKPAGRRLCADCAEIEAVRQM